MLLLRCPKDSEGTLAYGKSIEYLLNDSEALAHGMGS
jgi:hypothetical protein